MKIIGAKDDEIDRLNKRIEQLLAEPAAPKTAGAGGYFALSKEADAGGVGAFQPPPSEDDLAKALGAMSEEDRALLLIKASRQLPRPVTMVAT